MFATITLLAATLAGQAAPKSPAEAPTPAARLATMKQDAALYDFARDGGPLTLGAEPVFRLGNQSNNVLEGAIFLWVDNVGRPEAAAQVFLFRFPAKPEGEWLHEFTSLSAGTFVANKRGIPTWMPSTPGVAFKPTPGAPKPAATPSARLRQMRAIADEFKADDDHGRDRFEPLRLLPTPVARYGKPGATPEDGALFAFVEGTDPEVFLFIESRPGANGPEWQYACAPMSCWALKVTHKGQKVWDVPKRPVDDVTKPFCCLTHRP